MLLTRSVAAPFFGAALLGGLVLSACSSPIFSSSPQTPASGGQAASIQAATAHSLQMKRPNLCQVNQPCTDPSPLPTVLESPAPVSSAPPPSGSIMDVPDHGGPTLNNVTQHLLIYNNGYPANNNPSPYQLGTFIYDFSQSAFLAHMLPQYTTKGHYTFDGIADMETLTAKTGTATYFNGSGTESEPYYDLSAITQDIINYAGKNTGPNNLYSVILPVDDYLICTPGNFANCIVNQFQGASCGTHDIMIGPNGPIFFTFQHGWPACEGYSFLPGNSDVTVSPTALQESTLLHEIMESISDPYWDGYPFTQGCTNNSNCLPGSQQPSAYQDYNGEIADLCENWIENQNFNGDTYEVQPVWSNKDADCYPEQLVGIPIVPITLNHHPKTHPAI